jgi:hypothetical protein
VRALQAEVSRPAELVVAQRLVAPAVQAEVVGAVREAQQVPRVLAAQPQAAPEAAAVWDVVVVPQPAAESAGVARRPEAAAAAVPGVAEVVPRRAAAPASVEAVRRRGAPAGVPDEAAVRRRGARDEARGALLLAAAWGAVLPSIRCQEGRLAPSARAQSARARESLRIAQP